MSRSLSRQMADRVHRAEALAAALEGRASANSASLARSYGLSVPDVQAVLRNHGVRDDG